MAAASKLPSPLPWIWLVVNHLSTSLHHHPKKRFGQNFLIDIGIIGQLIDIIRPLPGEAMVEIGPGRGAMTRPLLSRLGTLIAVEIDRGLAAKLQGMQGLTVHTQDVLAFDFAKLPTPLRIVGNLPYNISTPLLIKLCGATKQIQDMHVMIQKEVGDRMVASVGSKDYGRLSVLLQYHFELSLCLHVPPTAFYPPPKVESCFVRMLPRHAREVDANDLGQLEQVVAMAFQQRRKTVKNSLSAVVPQNVWEELNLSPQMRAEELSVTNFVRLSNALKTSA